MSYSLEVCPGRISRLLRRVLLVVAPLVFGFLAAFLLPTSARAQSQPTLTGTVAPHEVSYTGTVTYTANASGGASMFHQEIGHHSRTRGRLNSRKTGTPSDLPTTS